MHTLTFFPLGNADCCRIKLPNGDRILFDYAHTRDESDKSDKRWDLASDIRDDLKKDKRVNNVLLSQQGTINRIEIMAQNRDVANPQQVEDIHEDDYEWW